MQLVRVSPKGQITIPKNIRDTFANKQLLLEVVGKTIILRSVIIQYEEDELKDFSHLSEPAMTFMGDDQDDIYQKYYSSQQNPS